MKNIISVLGILFFVSLTTWQCQYPLDDIDQPEKQIFLVVTANFTNIYGRILVEYSSEEIEGENIPFNNPPPLDGTAQVVDSQGNSITFNINGEKNTAFHGVPGETYQLFIETEGKEFESIIETMPQKPLLDTVVSEFNTKSFLLSTDRLHHGFDIIARFKDFPEPGNYYMWDWAHYERRLFCGFIEIGGEKLGLPCDGDCFNINYNRELTLLSDALVNGEFVDLPILRVAYATPPLRYYLRITQKSITKNAYAYFRAVSSQTQSNGNQFDVPSQTLFSTNIHCTSHPGEKVLGVFNLFSSTDKILVIDREVSYPNAARIQDYPEHEPYHPDNPLISIPSLPCGPETRYGTVIVPEGWKE